MAKGKKKTVSNPKTEVRLKPTEQVRDRKKEGAVGFGATGGGTYEPFRRLSIAQLRDLISTTVWAETCINTIVDEVIKHPLYTSPTDPDIDSFLKYPSDKEPLMMIRKQYLKDMLRWGNGACIVEYDGNNPSGLVVTPGYTLRVTDEEPATYKLLKLGSSSEFKEDGSGNVLEFSDKELMHFCFDKDSDSTLGTSNMERAYNDLIIDKRSSEKMAEFVNRGFFKPSFISFKKGVSVPKADLEDFVEYMNSLMSEGAKVIGINKEVDLKDIPYLDINEMIEMQRWVGLKTASVFKVPPFMLNLVQDVGSLNAREQKARFLENVIMPILQYEIYIFNSVITRKGFEKLGDETEITSTILATKLNYDKARIARLLVGTQDSILTTDEARDLFFNLQPKEEDNDEA